MIDLCNLPTGAVMRLTKCVPRRDGASLVWDTEMSMEVLDEAAASVVDSFVPGALRAFKEKDSSKGEAKTSGGFDLATVEFHSSNGDRLAGGHCEIRGATEKCSASQAVLLLKLRVHGLTPEAALELVYSLDEQLEVRITGMADYGYADGGSILLDEEEEKNSQLVGQLIVHNTGEVIIAGIVTDFLDQSLIVSTMEHDDPIVINIGGETVDTALPIVLPPDIDNQITAYQKNCKDKGIVASWHDMIVAFGRLYARQEIQIETGGWVLTNAVWEEAFKYAANDG